MKWIPTLVCLFAISTPLRAARMPDDPSQADYVTTGKVEKVFTRKQGITTSYLIQLRVEAIEKGSGYKPKDLMYIHCYQRKPELAVGQDPGHKAVPQEGQTIQAIVHRRKSGILEGNFPNWFEPYVESKVLKAELRKLLKESLKMAKSEGEKIPASADPKKLADRLIEDNRKFSPHFLKTTPEVEARWKQGKFDDKKAAARTKQAVKTLENYNATLPILHQQLLKQYHLGILKGARQEVAAELFEARVAKLVKDLTGE